MAAIALDNPKGSKPIILALHLAVGPNCLLLRDNKLWSIQEMFSGENASIKKEYVFKTCNERLFFSLSCQIAINISKMFGPLPNLHYCFLHFVSWCDFISKECKSLLMEEFSQNISKNDEGKRIVIFFKYKQACKWSRPRVFRGK